VNTATGPTYKKKKNRNKQKTGIGSVGEPRGKKKNLHCVHHKEEKALG
jgi:hypothetical protein